MRAFASLTSRLVLVTVALVAAVSLLLGIATTLVLRSYLMGQLDDKVQASFDRASHSPDVGLTVSESPDPRDADDVRGQGVGTVTARWYGAGTDPLGQVITEGTEGSAGRMRLSAETLGQLRGVPADGRPHTVSLDDLGTYRLIARTGGGARLVVGLPEADVTDTVSSLVWWEGPLILLGTGLACAAGAVVVGRQLRPLREVARTAHTVAALPLATGDIELAERVPSRLTDERTEVGQVGHALNTLLAHVESSLSARHQSEQQVRQFVADASHELRTPLTTIAGYTELARRRPDDPATAATALAKVEEESARMTAMVEDLLLLARLDAGRPLERRPVDLSRLLVEAVSDARVVAPEHHWRLDLPEDSIEVRGDEHRLHQVVTNLLGNARKHTPPGTSITVAASPDGFSVHDDGPGFPPGLAASAFERFVRGDASRTRAATAGRDTEGGVGLGLSLVHAIVTAHGGSVSVDSRPGSTTVQVSLGDSP